MVKASWGCGLKSFLNLMNDGGCGLVLIDFSFCFAAEDLISCEKLQGEDSASTQDADDILSSPPASQRPLRLDMIPPPPSTNSNKRSSPLVNIFSGEFLYLDQWSRD